VQDEGFSRGDSTTGSRHELLVAQLLCKETYKIGGLFSVTGPTSFLGDPEKKSLQMAIDEINARGGIDGHQLEP